MARNRITFFFTSNRGYGWTETLYTFAPTLDIAMTQAKALLPVRVNLMGRGSFLQFIRVSDDLVKRDSQVYPVPNSDRETKSRAGGDADIANTCCVVRIESGVLKRRTLFLRGIPDDIVLDNGIFRPTPAFTANFTLWAAVLFAGGFAIRVRSDVGAPVDLTNVSTVGPTGLVTITTAGAHGLVPNNVANIRGVLGATQVRGLQRVITVVDASNFQIRVNRVVKPYLGGGNVVLNDYSLAAISNAVVVRCSHHNAGRPFDAPRGRRLVR